MINLMVGNNFDEKLPETLIELNRKNKDKGIRINEVFGSIRSLDVIQSARPPFRVPDVSLEVFKKINLSLREAGITVNYTINTPLTDHTKLDEGVIKEFMAMLVEEYFVNRVTVAHPLLMKVISKVSSVPIEISTIYRVKHPRQLYDLKEMAPNINKVCADVYTNRNGALLRELTKHAKKLNIQFELLANEFCIDQCAVRDQCYHAHVVNKTIDDTKKFGAWPMGYCIGHREQDPAEWLYANFILPQHMKIYQDIFDIDSFKITGRTAPTKYLSWIIEQYMNKNFDGNLLELWQDVKNISRVEKGIEDFIPPKYEIKTNPLDINFLLPFLKDQQIPYDDEKKHVIEFLGKTLVNK